MSRETEPSARNRTRRVDLVSLVAGVITAVLFGSFLFGELDTLDEIARVVWPTVLLGVGAGLLLGSIRR